MARGRFGFVLLLAAMLTTLPVVADGPPATSPPQAGSPAASMEEMNKQLSNPIASIWSIGLQQNNYLLEIEGQDEHWNSNLNLQPVMPVDLTGRWGLVTRPVLTLVNSVPYPAANDPARIRRTTALGDTVLMMAVAPGPALVGRWLLALGPTFIFPTATSDHTGQGKWQVGPAGLVGYLSDGWIAGIFVQNWTSFAGDGRRPDANQMNLQPIMAFFLPHRWTIGYSGNVLANWKAESGERWTVPIGLGVSKLLMAGRLPVKVGFATQYMLRHPANFGQRWNFQINLTPVIPKLVKGPLF